MPFGFGRKKDEPSGESQAVPAAALRGPREIVFRGLTEEWRLEGTMEITGRLLDTLNKREDVPVSGVDWAPLDGSAPFEPAPGIKAIDPYDLIVVIAGAETLPTQGEDERTAHRVHKISFDVRLQVPPLRVIGTIQLHPGSEPESLLERSSQMFAAVTNATVSLGDKVIELGEDVEAVLVNRFYLRGVDQVDLSTGERHVRLPGVPLGGTTWRERS